MRVNRPYRPYAPYVHVCMYVYVQVHVMHAYVLLIRLLLYNYYK